MWTAAGRTRNTVHSIGDRGIPTDYLSSVRYPNHHQSQGTEVLEDRVKLKTVEHVSLFRCRKRTAGLRVQGKRKSAVPPQLYGRSLQLHFDYSASAKTQNLRFTLTDVLNIMA